MCETGRGKPLFRGQKVTPANLFFLVGYVALPCGVVAEAHQRSLGLHRARVNVARRDSRHRAEARGHSALLEAVVAESHEHPICLQRACVPAARCEVRHGAG